MGFLNKLFQSRVHTAESVVLIDIGAKSIAGAYARYVENEVPALLYTRRLPIEIREGEPHRRAMLRSLKILGDVLVREGAPMLMHSIGNGSADTIFVSVDAPWQETSVRTEHFEQKTPFVFTRSLVANILKKTDAAPPEKMLTDESIIGTILNGYETRNPYGKRIRRASVVILTSFIDQQTATGIVSTLQSIYHTKDMLPIAGSSLRYQAIRALFPHERDALILDVTGSSVAITLIRKGLFVAIFEAPEDIASTAAWVNEILHGLAELAERYPLPRTIFLLARESEISSVRQSLGTANLGSLWLSDNPPKIVSILASHVIGLVQQRTETPLDVRLLLMALCWHHRDINK